AVLLLGYRAWPGIALGAFLINASTGVGLAVAAGIAVGTTLEALAGVYLLRRLTGFRAQLELLHAFIGLVYLDSVVCPTLSAIISLLGFAIFPFSIWSALRFSQREAATTTLVASAIAIWDTARQIGPFAGQTLTESFLLLQAFMSVVAVTALVLGAATGGRRR